jgi:hypothetical protein
MKALEPVLKHHFWILLGLGLILALVGWWMTTGSMQAATATARGELAAADKNRDVGEVPSDDWTKNLKAINAEQKSLVDRTWVSLFAKQKEKMVWPEIVAEAASKLKYRENFENPILKTVYRDNYYKEVERVYRIPRPIDELDDSGIVHFPLSVLPHIEWGDNTPTYQQMWDTMEDLWLLEPILQAVFETNGGETAKRHEAIVVAIEYLGLYGGDRSKIGQSEGQQGGGGGGGTEGGTKGAGGVMGPSMSMPKTETGGGLIGGGQGGGKSAQTIATDIKEVEEFGDPGSANQGGGGGTQPGNAGGSPNYSSGAAEGPRRYIDDDDTKPFRTRGFKLTVAMDHRKVPDLYAHLTSSESSPWPIQILRMNVARLSETGAFAPGGGGGGGPKERRAGGGKFGGGGGLFGGGNLGGNQPGGEIAGNAPSASEELMNPFLARVTIVGLITLYNEPPATESAAGTPPTATQPATNDLPAEPIAGEPAATSAQESASEEPEPALSADDAEKADPEKTDAPVGDPAPQDDPAGAGEPSESKPADGEIEDKPAASEPGAETPPDEGAPEPK